MTKPREAVIFILTGALIVGLIGTVMAGGTLTGGAIVLVFLVLAFLGIVRWFNRLDFIPGNSIRGAWMRNNIAVTTIITAIMFLIAGCQTKPVSPSELVKQPQPAQAQSERAVWRISERPFTDLNFRASCGGGNCIFYAKGMWKSSTGKPGSELSDPISVTINCDKGEKQCIEIEASVDRVGFLDSNQTEFRVSSWSEDQIVATVVAGLCDIGQQLVIDLPGKTTILRIYPTKEPSSKPNDPCAIFSDRNSYVLHGGHWQLQPPAPRVME